MFNNEQIVLLLEVLLVDVDARLRAAEVAVVAWGDVFGSPPPPLFIVGFNFGGGGEMISPIIPTGDNGESLTLILIGGNGGWLQLDDDALSRELGDPLVPALLALLLWCAL